GGAGGRGSLARIAPLAVLAQDDGSQFRDRVPLPHDEARPLGVREELAASPFVPLSGPLGGLLAAFAAAPAGLSHPSEKVRDGSRAAFAAGPGGGTSIPGPAAPPTRPAGGPARTPGPPRRP